MTVRQATNGKCSVTFTNTHMGHQNDLRHMPISTEDCQDIAYKLAVRMPFENILNVCAQ